MRFTVFPYGSERRARALSGTNQCFLIADNWDDYGSKTSFVLIYFDGDGERHDVGAVKIMRRGAGTGYTPMDAEFDTLGPEYASLGQAQSYYEDLQGVADEVRVEILSALNDVIWNEQKFADVEDDPVFNNSLTRSIKTRELERFRAIVRQQAKLTPFHFRYRFSSEGRPKLTVRVHPQSMPASNVHVVIGRNGVGKTTLLRNISALLREGRSPSRGGLYFLAEGEPTTRDAPFANLVVVSFSAFDEFQLVPDEQATRTGIKYGYVGLRKLVKSNRSYNERNKSDADLTLDFINSTLTCVRSSRRPRWASAMQLLGNDPGFAALRLLDLVDAGQGEAENLAREIFQSASSGHKVVLLAMTRLVELVSESTLVLIDEPEAHLHPPLAALYVRALSELLSVRNGVALLATHSPVIAQQVPRSCVSLFFREGDDIQIAQPSLQTFGENVGVLTRDIFRVETEASSYFDVLEKVASEASSLEEAYREFDGLGAEARALLRALWGKHNP